MRDEILPRLVPEAPRLLLDDVAWGEAKAIPSTYIRLVQDHDVGLRLQDRVISRLRPMEVVGVDSGHLAMTTDLERVAGIINVDEVKAPRRKCCER